MQELCQQTKAELNAWNQTALCELSKTGDCQVLTVSIRMLPGTLATGDTCKKRAAQSKEARDVWNSLTVPRR
jgi:hypothetical protein